jgi:shikimate kinase
MGSGKSTVGRDVASRLGAPFVDLDASVEEAAGTTVAEIFASRGEGAFRELEREAVRRAVASPGRVVAAGGGAFSDEANARLLLGYGPVVWLRVRPATVLARLEGNRDRPLLEGEDREKKVKDLMEARSDAYGKAHIVVDCDDLSPSGAAEEVVRRIRSFRVEP